MLKFLLNISNLDSEYWRHAMANVICSEKIDSFDDSIKCVQLLLAQNSFNINEVDYCGRGLLMLAAGKANTHKIIKLLLKQKQLNINLRDHAGNTALINATTFNQYAINMRLLLRHPNIEINQEDNHSRNALCNAAAFDTHEYGLLCARQVLNHLDCKMERCEYATFITRIHGNWLMHALLTHARI
jgi:ankyrin repeat protein